MLLPFTPLASISKTVMKTEISCSLTNGRREKALFVMLD